MQSHRTYRRHAALGMFFMLLFACSAAFGAEAGKLPNVMILATGGTIAGTGATTAAVIARYDLKAHKSLGQNFLHDLNLTRRIARSAAPLRPASAVCAARTLPRDSSSTAASAVPAVSVSTKPPTMPRL